MQGSNQLKIILFLGFVFSANIFAQGMFGNPGYNGRSGMNGRNGQDGRNEVIFASNNYSRYDLKGSSAEDGTYGESGGNATSCFAPINPNYNLFGADGGNGGNGGNGGHGGSGGDVTVYFSDIEQLKNIHLDNSPGKAGRGSYGGQAGSACRCRTYSWTVVDANGNSSYYSCQDGRQGQQGRRGINGNSGSFGRLKLIGQTSNLAPTLSDVNTSLLELSSNPVTLSKNLWSTLKTSSLFYPGSFTSKEALLFEKRIEKTLDLNWNAPRPLEEVANASINLHLDNQNLLSLDSSDIWLDFDLTQDEGNAQLNISQALFPKEALNLKTQKIYGNNKNLSIQIKDLQDVSDIISTKFYIYYYTSNVGLFYFLRHEGYISQSLVQLDGDVFTLNIGRLPLHSSYTQSGRKVQIKIIALRNLKENKGVKNFEHSFRVP